MTPKKAFFAMTALLLIVMAVGGGIFYLVDEQLESKASEVSSLKADIDILDLKIKNSRDAAIELEKYEDVSSILDDVLPPKKIQDDIIAEILDITERNNAGLNDISFAASVDGLDGVPDFSQSQTSLVDGVAGVLAVNIRLSTSATFDDMLKLLKDFEQNQRKMQVVSVDVAPLINEEGNPTGKFTIALTINAYQRAG